jgi:EPS-associated MarR family transcriptional regulator
VSRADAAAAIDTPAAGCIDSARSTVERNRGKPMVPPIDESHYRIMRLIEANPGLSQRDIARELGVSVGKVNYCLRAVARKGWIKATNFRNSQNKAAYLYWLTPRGVQMKARMTAKFLSIKVREYEALRAEIEQMRNETESAAGVYFARPDTGSARNRNEP